MMEECTECAYCMSSNVMKVVANIVDDVDQTKFKSKAGDLVKSHIEEAREDIRKQKKEMKRGFE